MNIEQFREHCLQMKGASESMPFIRHNVVAFKIMGKMFCMMPLEPLDGIFTADLKCDPQRSLELRELYAGITYGQDDKSYDALMAKMREYTWEKKEYYKAIEIGKELLDRYPNNTSVELFLGNLYFYTEQDSLAVTFLEKALSKEPRNTDILNSLFHLSYKRKDYETAERYLDRLSDQDADNIEYQLRRVQVYSANGREEAALTLLKEFGKEYPDNEAGKIPFGTDDSQANSASGNSKERYRSYVQAIDVQPGIEVENIDFGKVHTQTRKSYHCWHRNLWQTFR